MNDEKPVVQHVENTSYENDLKEALGYGEEVYFYQVTEVLAELGLCEFDGYQPMYGDVAFLVSNQPLSDEQLREEVEPYIPKSIRKQQLAQRIGEQIVEDQPDATAKETVRKFAEFMKEFVEDDDDFDGSSIREALEAFDTFLDDVLGDGPPYEIKTSVAVESAVVIVDLEDGSCVLRLDSREIAEEDRERKRQMAEEERANVERESQKQQQMAAVREHLRDCKQCTVEFYGGPEFLQLQYSGPNFLGQVCEAGYNLIQPLLRNGIYWRGHALKAPKAAA